jgi:hypothetical protein
MFKSIEDLTEPDTDGKKFNLSIKQLQFIQNDSNLKFVNEIMKTMKKYKFEIEDVNMIIEKHNFNEEKKQERNEARRFKKQQEQINNNDNDEDGIKSNIRSSKRSKKRSSKKK